MEDSLPRRWLVPYLHEAPSRAYIFAKHQVLVSHFWKMEAWDRSVSRTGFGDGLPPIHRGLPSCWVFPWQGAESWCSPDSSGKFTHLFGKDSAFMTNCPSKEPSPTKFYRLKRQQQQQQQKGQHRIWKNTNIRSISGLLQTGTKLTDVKNTCWQGPLRK